MSRKKSGISLGLSRMRELCACLRNPEQSSRFIHVAGTNGKGSVAAYISSILSENGYHVGRYVSPTVFCYEEGIQFETPDGISYIDKSLLAECITEVAAAASSMEKKGLEIPTGFEMETAAAFLAFQKKACDIVILEVGLGGREDATNVIENVVASVITGISMDHMGVLGNTIQKIASEKAGIIREQIPVISCQQSAEAARVISAVCQEKKSPLTNVCRTGMTLVRADLDGFDFIYRGEHFHSRMAGSYQMENASTAIEVCRQLGSEFPVEEENIKAGIAKAFWHGRFEVIGKEPLVIIDGAHNESGARALAESIRTFLPNRKIHGVMGVFKDKEYEKIAAVLTPWITDVVAVTAPTDRGLPAEKLQAVWELPSETADSIEAGIKAAMQRCEKKDAVVVFGSLSLLSHCSCGKIKISV